MKKTSNKTKRWVRIWGRLFFVLYLILALYIMFFSESLDRTRVGNEYRYNLVLFHEIERFWSMRADYGWHVTIVNLLGNVICFVPFGFLLPTISKNSIFKNVIGVTAFAFLFSLSIETIQLLTKVGAFDVDDIFLNTIGGFLGYVLMKFTTLRKHI